MMHNPNITYIRTYTLKVGGKEIESTTDKTVMEKWIEGYTLLAPCGTDRQTAYPDFKASTDHLTVISTGNYASMGGFVLNYYK